MSQTIVSTSRYVRQEILGQFGAEGQERLRQTQIGLVGAGALGSTIADLLVRAGIGKLTLVDRDYVELHNLQRQSLYSEPDVDAHLPKAAAAAQRLAEINRDVMVKPVIADINSVNIESLLADCAILVDGTDNFETRYLINDLAVKTGRPWVYGGVLATYGMTATIIPNETACLRCVFPETPGAGSIPTCETAGVLGPAVHVIAALQASEAIKLALGHSDRVNRHLVSIDIWNMEMTRVPTGSPRSDCPTCGERRFDFLNRATPNLETSLCGHDAVQVMVSPAVRINLDGLGARLRPIGDVLVNRFLVRFTDPATGHELTVFPDGRAIIKGVTEPAVARAVYDRYVGS